MKYITYHIASYSGVVLPVPTHVLADLPILLQHVLRPPSNLPPRAVCLYTKGVSEPSTEGAVNSKREVHTLFLGFTPTYKLLYVTYRLWSFSLDSSIWSRKNPT